jgi:plastocyanin
MEEIRMNGRAVAAILFAGAFVAACAGQQNGATTMMMPPAGGMTTRLGNDMIVDVTMPKDTVGEELPGEGLGSLKSPFWGATLGGFTQMQYSQQLAFPPGTKITIRNLSKSISHTLNVVAKITGHPAKFPANPTLSQTPKGGGKFGLGYASGVIKPGGSVTMTLATPGTYLIGCAFHYDDGMRDVFVVSSTQKPGNQATPMPRATQQPTNKPTSQPTTGW